MPLFADDEIEEVSYEQQPLIDLTINPSSIAQMLHKPDPQQRKRAHKICGSTTIYNRKGGVRLYCRRRDCPYCFRRRYRKVAIQIRLFVDREKEAGRECQLHWQKIPASEHTFFCRDIRNRYGEYMCFPVLDKDGNEMEYIVSNSISGHPLHLDHSRLEATLAIWTKTPRHRKISCSSGFHIPDDLLEKKHYTNYFAHERLEKIIPHVEKVGGKIIRTSKSYVQWEVDPEKLTDHLNQNDVVAYQLELRVLNSDLREAEQELGMASGTLTREVWDAALAVRDKLLAEQKRASIRKIFADGIPVDKHGKPIIPLKLRHILSNSYATVSCNEETYYGKSAPPS